MSILAVADIGDLISSTLADLRPLQITDLQHATQTFRGFNRLFQRSRMDVQSGTDIKINILTDFSQNSRFKGLYQVDPDGNQDDALTIGSVPWRFGDWWWAFDEHEPEINQGPAQIQRYVDMKRFRAFNGWAKFLEDWWWDTPPETTDKKTPYNLRYWFQKDVTTAGDEDGVAGSGSFAPAMPGSHTTIAGVDASSTGAAVRYNNWKYKFVDVSEDDLIQSMYRMMRYINFEPPEGMMYPSHSGSPSHEHLMGSAVYGDFEKLVKQRNDNLGSDFAARRPSFGLAPLTWCMQLNDDSDDPIYTMDWGTVKTVLSKGRWMRPKPPMRAARQHNVWMNWNDMVMNVIVNDRRRCAVGSRAAANA